MIFHETGIAGAWLIDLEPICDDRGFFARAWCKREFDERGLDSRLVQCNVSYNRRRGTLRGLHFQVPPHGEAKLVRCTAGAIWDVIVDLRAESPTLNKARCFELTAANHSMLYIPVGVAHGYQTLQEHSEVFYQVSEYYNADASRGLAWNDPAFQIEWPIGNPILSEKDRTAPHVSRRSPIDWRD